MKEDFLVFCRI